MVEAAPSPVFRPWAQTGKDRIEHHVGVRGNEVASVGDPPAPVTATDELPNTVVACVEVPAIGHIQLFHPKRERGVGYRDDEVDVRAQLAERHAHPIEAIDDAREKPDPDDPVVVVDVVALIPRRVHPDMA